ncbi:MAG: phospho-N-acetylmuramoyl-pentapeptide-transferase [Helicobacteraceae bacterium]|jgi:phospho-N-acetylmuramoyl-pentapeptide-transferase|nr:phospho-N-acetylmuramoyl-pentapeptide-transferase [Helicobacteraceae bacterium]
MLYFLSELFRFNLLTYITVRAGAAFCIAFALTLWWMPRFIVWAKRRGAIQPILSQAPTAHKGKQNTPTMGGLIFVVCAVIATLLSADLKNGFVWIGIAALVLYTAIGTFDDMRKILRRKNDAGLSAKVKFIAQFTAAVLIALALLNLTNLNAHIYIPFVKEPIANIGAFVIVFWVLVIVSASNAVNLTDGLDGLAVVPSIFALSTLAVLMYLSGHAILSQSLLLPRLIGVGEVVVCASALLGGLLGFLWYNANPAEVFMGDSGSLSIGAFVAYSAILSKNEILLILICFIFVVETISVILQVGSYKLRRRRMFLMAPLHHHFELMRWAENKIIVRFWIIALLSNVLALITIKIR